MKLEELFEDDIITETAVPIWARDGDEIVRKFRCTSGRKKGRIVANAASCGGTLDLKKRMQLKKTLLKKKALIARKSKRTKTKNPVSIRLQKLNKLAGR